MARKGGMGGGGMDTSLLFSNLVITATLGLGAIGWIVAFIGQIAAEANFRHQGVLWFSIFLEIFLILGIAYTVVTNNVGAASHQISLFLAVALVFSVIGIDSGIYAGVASANAVAAGWFILTITNIIWLLFFTSEEDSASYGLLNRFGNGALNGPGSGRRNRGGGGGGGAGSAIRSNGGVHDGTGYGGGFGSQTAGGYQPAFNSGPSAADLSMNASKSNGMAGGAGSIRSGQAAAGMGAGALAGSTMGRSDYGQSSDPVRVPSPTSTHKQSAPGTVEGGAGEPTPGYGYKARALYAYQANSDDPTEISFSKGEVLDIVDNSGKWWQARKSDGETGIVPSNYMQVL